MEVFLRRCNAYAPFGYHIKQILMPVFNNIHLTQILHHTSRKVSIVKYTHSLCSTSTTVRLYRQETAVEHWGIYWAIIQGGIVRCGPVFTKDVILSIWGVFYFYIVQYSSLRLNTNPPHWLTQPPLYTCLNFGGTVLCTQYNVTDANL